MDEYTPLERWMDTHKPQGQLKLSISRWLEACVAVESALQIEDELSDWLATRSNETPDLVRCGSFYGYSLLLTQGWTKLPIPVPSAEQDAWRRWEIEPTIDEFWSRQAGAAGGFLELSGKASHLVADLIKKQLTNKVGALDHLLELKITETYTPVEFTEDQLTEGEDFAQQDHFDRPFVIRQELECFAWGFQKLRMYCLTNDVPELGLPNRALFDAFQKIDLNELTATLTASDVKLKEILKHLARHGYYNLDNPIDPESFWWRHWRAAQKNARSGTP